MARCEECDSVFDPAKDFFITVYERKARAWDFCSLGCTAKFINDEEA